MCLGLSCSASTLLGLKGFLFSASRISLYQALLSHMDTGAERLFILTYPEKMEKRPYGSTGCLKDLSSTSHRNKAEPCGFKDSPVAWIQVLLGYEKLQE